MMPTVWSIAPLHDFFMMWPSNVVYMKIPYYSTYKLKKKKKKKKKKKTTTTKLQLFIFHAITTTYVPTTYAPQMPYIC